MSYVSKVTSAGQVTLPKKVREALGVGPSSYVVMDALGKAAVLRKGNDSKRWFKRNGAGSEKRPAKRVFVDANTIVSGLSSCRSPHPYV